MKVTRWLQGVLELLEGARAELLAASANAVLSVVLLARVAAALLELTPLLRRLLSLTGAQLTQLHAPAAVSVSALRSSRTPGPDTDSRCCSSIFPQSFYPFKFFCNYLNILVLYMIFATRVLHD